MLEDYEKLKYLNTNKQLLLYLNYSKRNSNNGSDSVDWEPAEKKIKRSMPQTDDNYEFIEQAKVSNNAKPDAQDKVVKEFLEIIRSEKKIKPNKFRKRFKAAFGQKTFDKMESLLKGDKRVDDVVIDTEIADLTPASSEIRDSPVMVTRGSWNQSDEGVFGPNAGKQCCAMALAFIVHSTVTVPSKWTKETINEIMIEGNDLYQSTVDRLKDGQRNVGRKLPESGFLMVRDFDVLESGFEVFARSVRLTYKSDPEIYGCLTEIFAETEDEEETAGMPLLSGLERLFVEHSSGILISSNKAFAVIKSQDKFYFCDSHNSYAAGESSYVDHLACVIECRTLVAMCEIIMTVNNSEFEFYTLDSLNVEVLPKRC